jgi:phage FluMu gp28-like protein
VYQRGEKFFEDGSPKFGGTDNADPFPEWISIRMPTWTNPHVGMEAVEQMRSNLPEDVFEQEVAAKFLLDSAGVFRGIKDCVRGDFQPPLANHHYVMGVDLGRLRDYSVLTVMDRGNRHVVYWERFNQLSWEVQYHRIIAAAKRFRALAVIDSTGIGDPIVEQIQRAGVRVEPYKIGGSSAKQQLIDKLRVNIENQRISFPSIPVLRKELEAYEYQVTDTGVIRFSAPSGQHDDCVISLALANWGGDQEPFVYRFSNQRGL